MMSEIPRKGSREGIEAVLERLLAEGADADVVRELRGYLRRDVGAGYEAGLGEGIEDLGYARLDHDRQRRRGFPEVVYGPGKTTEQLVEIFERLGDRNPNVLATRVAAEAGERVCASDRDVHYDRGSGLLYLWREREPRGQGTIAVVSAGTSDQHVAYEAATCAEVMGNKVLRLRDVGVAGLQRLLNEVDRLRAARVIICVAGMEAALSTVVAGLVDRPVIAVPTSVGYGATFGGIAALLSSLTACASGVMTVNIDNGFGAAYGASLINRP